jgi:putative membrane protein
MMWGDDGFGGIGMGFGMLFFWGLIIAAVVVLVRALAPAPREAAAEVHARTQQDILGERYARGEIDKTDFEQKKRDLGG